MALIRYKRGVYCDKCEKLVPIGGDVYWGPWNDKYFCEECYDKYLSAVKSDAKVTVNKENFDLEVEE